MPQADEPLPPDDLPTERLPRLGSRSVMVAILVAVAAAWRLWLSNRYAGWEESDYGNLAMVRGVLDGGFVHFDMNHMPGYYALAAGVLAAVGDTVAAARLVSLAGGLVALGFAVALTDRLAGRPAAWVAGLLLTIQPEFALYSATSLREPLYAAWVLGALWALAGERLWLAGALAALAFSVRMDAALALAPALVLHAAGAAPRGRRVASVLAPVVAAVAGWALYCLWEHGTPRFWSGSVQANVLTGLGAEAESPGQWLGNGLSVVGRLLGWLLPWRIGWGVWVGMLVVLAGVPWRRAELARTWALLALSMLGVWAGIGLVAQHTPSHNLYWKWLCPIVPVVVPLGVTGLALLYGRARSALGGLGAGLVAVLVVGQGVVSNLHETRRQLDLSAAWYAPQRDLGEWFEAEVPDDVPLLLDNIPACWIDRKPNGRDMTSWFDVPVSPADAEGFSEWLRTEHIGWVLWFREDWTQAPVLAPFLAAGGTWEQGGVRLVETEREDGYGWILFRVEQE